MRGFWCAAKSKGLNIDLYGVSHLGLPEIPTGHTEGLLLVKVPCPRDIVAGLECFQLQGSFREVQGVLYEQEFIFTGM